ncbi:hypothetical protein OF83DRAFT_1086027 [Amylostereum chailletii]|nr:hypothetical protein OF83DRAFT_1086027 [Amylostereum chailletii]
MVNGVGASPVFARLGRARLPHREDDALNVGGDIGVLHMEDLGIWSADPRLEAVSLGFAISIGNLRGLNARAMYAAASSDSVVDYRFVRLVGLLAKMMPLRPMCDKVALREVGTGREYKVYGQVDVPFIAGERGFKFKMPCWVVDVAAPVEVVLGQDWLRKYKVEVSTSLEGQKVANARAMVAEAGRGARDVYVELA